MPFRVIREERTPDDLDRDVTWLAERNIECPDCGSLFRVEFPVTVVKGEGTMYPPLSAGEVNCLPTYDRVRHVRLRCPVCARYIEVDHRTRRSMDVFPFLTDPERNRPWVAHRSMGPQPNMEE